MRSPRFVAVFLAALILPQIGALVRQFELGFRPFGAAPTRVPLSWDMFATRIERCALTWSPPVLSPAGRVAALRDLTPGFEWDVVGDQIDQYEYFARKVCSYALVPTRAEVKCVTPEGRWEALGYDCP